MDEKTPPADPIITGHIPGWPYALVKATMDHFDYAAQIRDLGVVGFHDASDIGDGWVRLEDLFEVDHSKCGLRDGSGQLREQWPSCLPCPCDRGIEVRLSDILWVADAPHGS